MVDLLTVVRNDLKAKRGRAREVHAATGVPLSTLYRLRDEATPVDPRHSTLEKLRAYYARQIAA